MLNFYRVNKKPGHHQASDRTSRTPRISPYIIYARVDIMASASDQVSGHPLTKRTGATTSEVRDLTSAFASRPIRDAIKLREQTGVSPVQNLRVQMTDGNAITLEMSKWDYMTIGELKDTIVGKTKIPRNHQVLKIAGKPGLVMSDQEYIYACNKWNLRVLDMVLLSGDVRYIRVHVCDRIRYVDGIVAGWPEQPDYITKNEFILTVNDYDTIKEVKKQIFGKLMFDDYQLLFCESIQLCYSKSGQVDLEDCNDYSRLLTGNAYQKLSDDACTLKECGIVMFQYLLKLRVCFCRIKDDGVRRVYSVEIFDGLDTSHHNPDDYLLSVKQNITVNKLYSIVTKHYKVYMWHVVLTVNSYGISTDDMRPLYKVLCCPIIMYMERKHPVEAICMKSLFVFSEPDDCPNPRSCQLAKKVEDDPIIKHMVAVRDDSWMVIVNVFNIADEIRKEIEENSDDDRIRCMDVMHRMQHSDNHLTWEFVEIQVRREDPQLADTISSHL